MMAKAVLCDIEGTTTSISFVHDELFPLVLRQLDAYFETQRSSESLKKDMDELRSQWLKDEKDNVEGAVPIPEGYADAALQAAKQSVRWMMSQDRKVGALKQLQGHMWQHAYAKGAVKGHVYPDVKPAFERWIKAGTQVYIYSSGSIHAQKLLFGHSVEGDMCPLLSGYYDTTSGQKKDAESYTRIAKDMGFAPEDVIFFSDRIEECEASQEAGMRAVIVDRPGNVEIVDARRAPFASVSTFAGADALVLGADIAKRAHAASPPENGDAKAKHAKID